MEVTVPITPTTEAAKQKRRPQVAMTYFPNFRSSEQVARHRPKLLRRAGALVPETDTDMVWFVAKGTAYRAFDCIQVWTRLEPALAE